MLRSRLPSPNPCYSNCEVFYARRDGARGVIDACEQWIKEGKYALNWTRLSCHKFVANQVRLELFVLAYNLGNFMRRLVFQLAEVLVSREMLGGILERIGRLRLAPG